MPHLAANKYDTWVGVKTTDEIERNTEPLKAEKSDIFAVIKREATSAGLKRIGLELDFIGVAFYSKLRESLPGAEFIDISPLFIDARSVKTDEEIEMFRKLTEIQDNALGYAKDFIKVGASEKEIAEAYRLKVAESGFCLPSSWSMFRTGANCSFLGLPTDARIQNGDVFKYDGGVNAEFDFYTTDFSRSYLVGCKNKIMAGIKERIYAAQRRMIGSIRPGLPLSELFQTGFSYVKEKYKCYERGHLGHSISMGPQTAEAPYISPSETRAAEEGMVLCVEVPFYIRDLGGFNIEDMVVVTRDGCDVLTPRTPHFLPGE